MLTTHLTNLDFGNGCTKLSKEVQASRAGAVMMTGHKAVPHGTLEGMYGAMLAKG